VCSSDLLRRYGVSQTRRAFDLEVYRDQLGEIEGDLERGLITADQAEAARIEVQRRVLTLGGPEEPDGAPSAPGRQYRWIAFGTIGIGVPALALVLYFSVGSPGLPSQLYSAVPATSADSMAGRSVDEAILNLERRLADNPQDTNGWLLLGRSFIALERLEDAVKALSRAAELSQGNLDIMTMLGEAKVWSADGVVTPEALQLFEAVLAKRPGEPAARFYLGISRAQAGVPREALDIWTALAAETPVDAAWREDLVGLMNEAAVDLGIELADIPSAPATQQPAQPSTGSTVAEAPGPTAEDMAAAADMSPDERMDMIRGMVARLAARLENESEDLDGWQRLAGAYRVLGENAKAEQAEQRVQQLQGQQSGGDTPRNPNAPRGPDADDVAAAAGMSEGERSQMIRGMVENLAARLEREPDDLQGWLRLATSYQVLSEPAKSRDAFAAAANLAPSDVDIQGKYARAIMEAMPRTDGMPPAAVDVYRRILTLDENHAESLWFVGFADLALGDADSARELWGRLLERLPPDSPDFEAVQAAINAL